MNVSPNLLACSIEFLRLIGLLIIISETFVKQTGIYKKIYNVIYGITIISFIISFWGRFDSFEEDGGMIFSIIFINVSYPFICLPLHYL